MIDQQYSNTTINQSLLFFFYFSYIFLEVLHSKLKDNNNINNKNKSFLLLSAQIIAESDALPYKFYCA